MGGRNCMKRTWIWKALGREYNLVDDKDLLHEKTLHEKTLRQDIGTRFGN